MRGFPAEMLSFKAKEKKKTRRLKGILKRRTNQTEKCVAMLVQKYDFDGNKTLGQTELKSMLGDLDSTHEPTDESMKACLKLIKSTEKNEYWASSVMEIIERYNSYWHDDDYYEEILKKYEVDESSLRIPDQNEFIGILKQMSENFGISYTTGDLIIFMDLLTNLEQMATKKASTNSAVSSSHVNLNVNNTGVYQKHHVKAALDEWRRIRLEDAKDEENRSSSCARCIIV